MKINSSAGLEHYKNYAKAIKGSEGGKAKNAGGASKAAQGARSDKVTISGAAAARAEFSRLGASIGAEVDGAAGPGRMEELRAAVESGSYHVSSEDLADAILDRIV